MLVLADDVIEFTPVIVIGTLCTVWIIAIISRTITRIVVARAREETRREVAAYIAEGTITPEHGIALLEAGRTLDEMGNPAQSCA